MSQFLNLIQSDLCHPESMVLGPGPALRCAACQTSHDVYELVNRPSTDYFRSSELAQAYAHWTGDLQVPMSFPLSHIKGIKDAVVVGQSLERVERSVRLLRALNAPFTTDTRVERTSDMDTFLRDFLNIVYQHPQAESTDERVALHALMKSMHDVLSARDAINPFETYFNVLVPYAQRCLPHWSPFQAEPAHPNLARELHTQLVRSFCIRQLFGRYALPLDVIHVMVCCYACSCDMNVVGNWAIDFLVRICRGQFFWPNYQQCVFVSAMQRLVQTHITYKHNSHFFQNVVRPIKRGESIDHYSQMWIPLHEAQAYLKQHFAVPDTSPNMLDMAFSHTFPAVLFEECSDQLGFTMGYNHLVMTLNRKNGQLPKGAFKKARRIHSVVQRFVDKIRGFDAGKDDIWDLDMVRLFFVSDATFQSEIMEVIHMLVVDDDAEE